MFIHLVIVEPESRRGRHKVRLPLLVGRCPEAKFRIQQERVSRRHCELTATDGVVHLRDLGSRNGTVVGGVRAPADESLAVPPGTVVQVGTLSFVVEYDPLAETPTVAKAPLPSASSLTLALGPAADVPFEMDIRCDSDASPGPVGLAATDPPREPDDEDGDELQRFLEGLS